MTRFLPWAAIGVLFRKRDRSLGPKRTLSTRNLPAHILKDIGLSSTEFPSLTMFGGCARSRRRRP